MIYIRDDDVLLRGSKHPEPVKDFIVVHNIIESYGYMHCPAILTTEIEEFPEIIEFIRFKTKQGKMIPQLHGSSHIDYAKLSVEEIQADYKKCQAWFIWNLGVRFTKHYTPWGAGARWMKNGQHIRPVAEAMGIEIVDADGLIYPRHVLDDLDFSWQKYEGKELFIHWWDKDISVFYEALAKLKEAEKAIMGINNEETSV